MFSADFIQHLDRITIVVLGAYSIYQTTRSVMLSRECKKSNDISRKLANFAEKVDSRLMAIEKNMRTEHDCIKHTGEMKEVIKLAIYEHQEKCRQRRNSDINKRAIS